MLNDAGDLNGQLQLGSILAVFDNFGAPYFRNRKQHHDGCLFTMKRMALSRIPASFVSLAFIAS
jgi:hypothetical protein